MDSALKLGFIPARRAIFPAEPARRGRAETIEALKKCGADVVALDPSLTELGCVESLDEARATAALFRREEVRGIVIGAMNFGDEQAAALTIRMAALDVPVLIFGLEEEETLRPATQRRDSLCGLLSIGEALRQVGARYSVGATPIASAASHALAADIDWFARVCRVVTGIRGARFGQVGARPDAFWTCRVNEKALQRLGVTVVSLDLSEAVQAVNSMPDDSPAVREIVREMEETLDTSGVSKEVLARLGKFERFLLGFAETNRLDALAVQCWDSLQATLGICACLPMSRLGDRGIPCACESDVNGALSMHALRLAAGAPSALADINNLHNEDPDLVNVWHCGVFPTSYAKEKARVGAHFLMGQTLGPERASGVVEFRMKEGPLTLGRVTEDGDGRWKAFVLEGAVEANPAATSGAYGWCRISGFMRIYSQTLLRRFPHHAAIAPGHWGNALYEAFGAYLGMETYVPEQATAGAYVPGMPFG